ncbi:NAD(P)H-dependent oxidoreductase [Paenibacillus monticola]|uniref:FMN dependent NADH:quinone oxidoreductase n=1 Tax=Paenibacillus monticola TaxID=2666075 RepID=A0A7X2H9S0_9BACL|nr:NAD(P)H-dependent oxidoreductase [Paenibacillus monticola]MRN56156.1 FMN-dependent NADH-azoreductase [Paenibacillus monticola]
MSTLLYITAHPHDASTSYSLSVGEEFVQVYHTTHPQDEVIRLDLYQSNIPQIDADVFSGWEILQSGGAFEHLSPQSQIKVARLSELVDQFVAVDKIVIVNPVWNFLFPPVLKAYFDAVSVVGKTFRYSPTGPVGLIPTKKVLHIQASGSVLSEGPMAGYEFSNSYISKLFAFFGVPSINSIFVEGMSVAPEQADAIKDKAIQVARELAKSF